MTQTGGNLLATDMSFTLKHSKLLRRLPLAVSSTITDQCPSSLSPVDCLQCSTVIFILRLYSIYARSQTILITFTILLLAELGVKIVRTIPLLMHVRLTFDTLRSGPSPVERVFNSHQVHSLCSKVDRQNPIFNFVLRSRRLHSHSQRRPVSIFHRCFGSLHAREISTRKHRAKRFIYSWVAELCFGMYI